jgi:hypothetical protein
MSKKYMFKVAHLDDERGSGDGWFVYLKDGWCFDEEGLHVKSFDTEKEAREEVRDATRPCRCFECVQALGGTPDKPRPRPKGRPKGYRKPGGTKVRFSARLKAETVETIKSIADDTGKSQATVIEKAVEYFDLYFRW